MRGGAKGAADLELASFPGSGSLFLNYFEKIPMEHGLGIRAEREPRPPTETETRDDAGHQLRDIRSPSEIMAAAMKFTKAYSAKSSQ